MIMIIIQKIIIKIMKVMITTTIKVMIITIIAIIEIGHITTEKKAQKITKKEP